MRRRLTFLVLAVTSFVTVSYTVPLAILVDRQADEAARSDAVRLVQLVAAQVVEVVAGADDSTDVMGALPALPRGVSVVGDGGRLVGDPAIDTLAAGQAATDRQYVERYGDGGWWEVALPVVTSRGVLVVQSAVSPAELGRGVTRAWLFLAGLAVAINGAALLLADRLGRTLLDPVHELADAARRLGEGDLSITVGSTDLEELEVVADAFNRLAPRLRSLLIAEREAVADLSHRLRTPLAALRLQAEALGNDVERRQTLALVERMQLSVDRIIEDARSVDPEPACDVTEVAMDRAVFWAILAEEEGRRFDRAIDPGPMLVPAGAEELRDTLDVLIGNVFSHTERGVALRLEVRNEPGAVVVAVADEGPGFPKGVDAVRRGVSAAGSTGLGLDIARRLGERTGGGLRLAASPAGGALVELRLGQAAPA